jgi:isopenicillin-N N-acyltransferase-like protein
MAIAAEPGTLPVIACSGTPRERGRAHGEQLRGPIVAVLDRWRSSLAERHGTEVDRYITEFVANTRFLPTIELHTLGLLDEVRGIAEGAGQPFETMLAYNLMDEEWQYAEPRAAEQPGCTVACLVSDSSTPVIAQTMDIPSFYDGSQAAIHHKPDDAPEMLIFTGAGMLGLNGANAAGIGVVVNNLSMLPSSRAGLPVMFILRGLLEWTTLGDAVAFVENVPHAVGQHYAIGSPDGIAALEGAANGVVRVETSGRRYVHANHPVADEAVAGDQTEFYARSTTFDRYNRAAELIEYATDAAGIEAALSDVTVPISRLPKGGFMTFGATSITCSAPPVVRVAPGPPHDRTWTTIGF